MKKLYRSSENKVFAGIMGGFGEYFSVDPVVFRALAVLLFMLTGFVPGIIAYIVLIFVIPQKQK